MIMLRINELKVSIGDDISQVVAKRQTRAPELKYTTRNGDSACCVAVCEIIIDFDPWSPVREACVAV